MRSPSLLLRRLALITAVLAFAGPARSAPDAAKPDEEKMELPKMHVKGVPVTSFGIGIAGTRERATRKIKRLFVSEVVYGTEAARLGLQEQDEILAINGTRVTELDGTMQTGSDLFNLLVDQPVNKQITLEVMTRQPGTFILTSRQFHTPALAPKHSHPPHFISVSIARSPAEVYAFAGNPENLPKWASGLSRSIKRADDQWVAESPLGTVRIKFADRNTVGVLDHEVTLPSGETVYNPLRVQPNGTGSEVVFTLYRRPNVTVEDFQRDAGRVREDLKRLKALLE